MFLCVFLLRSSLPLPWPLSIPESCWLRVDPVRVSRALWRAVSLLGHCISFSDLGTLFWSSCLMKELKRLLRKLTFVSTLEYRRQFHRHWKYDSDSGWLIERPLIQRNSKEGRPARERAGFRWLDVQGPETQLVLYLLPTLLSEATTQSFEISKGFDLTVRSLLKSKEEEISLQKSLKNSETTLRLVFVPT